jgi:hypothetical protein
VRPGEVRGMGTGRVRSRAAARLWAAIDSKDLRVRNRYPKVKKPRVGLDLRKKSA